MARDPTRVKFTVEPIDDGVVPAPHASKRGPYRDIAEEVVTNQSGQRINCPDRKVAHAAYQGMKRAQRKMGPHRAACLDIRSSVNEDGQTVTVFVEYRPPS